MIEFIVYEEGQIPIDLAKEIYTTCGWGWPKQEKSIAEALSKSYLGVMAFKEKRPIAFGRIISDGFAYALLVDVMVSPRYRRQKVGTRLLETVIEQLKSRKINLLKLISSEDGFEFYKGLGFKVCPPNAPGMMLSLAQK